MKSIPYPLFTGILSLLSFSWISDAAAQAPDEPEKKVLGLTQTSANAVLVQRLDGRSTNPIVSVRPSPVSGFAREIRSRRDMFVRFEQSVGRELDSSLDNVMKHYSQKFNPLPTGYEVRLSFDENLVPRNDPSAALACGVTIHSMLTGEALDAGVAYAADLDSMGKTGKGTLMCERIYAAATSKVPVLIISAADASFVADTILLHGPNEMVGTQIYAVTSLAEAIEIAKKEENRSADMNDGMQKYSQIQAVLVGKTDPRLFKNQHVVARLDAVATQLPSMVSAKYLKMIGTGEFPANLSPGGSYYAINRAVGVELNQLRDQYGYSDNDDLLSAEELEEIESNLVRQRRSLHPDFLEISDSIVEFTSIAREFIKNGPKTYDNRRKALQEVNVKFELMKAEMAEMDRMPAVINYKGE